LDSSCPTKSTGRWEASGLPERRRTIVTSRKSLRSVASIERPPHRGTTLSPCTIRGPASYERRSHEAVCPMPLIAGRNPYPGGSKSQVARRKVCRATFRQGAPKEIKSKLRSSSRSWASARSMTLSRSSAAASGRMPLVAAQNFGGSNQIRSGYSAGGIMNPPPWPRDGTAARLRNDEKSRHPLMITGARPRGALRRWSALDSHAPQTWFGRVLQSLRERFWTKECITSGSHRKGRHPARIIPWFLTSVCGR